MINSIELFSGTGGLALGLQQAGFNHHALLEWDRDSCDNIQANIDGGYSLIRDWNVIQTDVRLVQYGDFGCDIQFIAGGRPASLFRSAGSIKLIMIKEICFPKPFVLFGN